MSDLDGYGFGTPGEFPPGILSLFGGGVYAIVAKSILGWGHERVLYIGETADFSDRPAGPGHEKWAHAEQIASAFERVQMRFREIADPMERKRLESSVDTQNRPCVNT